MADALEVGPRSSPDRRADLQWGNPFGQSLAIEMADSQTGAVDWESANKTASIASSVISRIFAPLCSCAAVAPIVNS